MASPSPKHRRGGLTASGSTQTAGSDTAADASSSSAWFHSARLKRSCAAHKSFERRSDSGGIARLPHHKVGQGNAIRTDTAADAN